MAEAPSHESFSAVYSAACRHHTPDGRRASRWFCCLSTVAGVRASPGGLPYDPDSNFLSRRESRRDGFIGYRSPRAPVRPNPRPQPNDLHEFVRELGHHSPIRSRTEYRYCRTGSSSCHQRCFKSFAAGAPESSHLQQSQSRRLADSYSRPHVKIASAFQGGRSRRHHARAKNLPIAGRRPG